MADVKRQGSRDDLEAKLTRGGLTGMSAWVDLASDRARRFAPVKTGRLFRSIHPDDLGPQQPERLRFIGLFGTNVEYAMAHEFGSGIHALDPSKRELILIEPGYFTGKSNKKALSFAWPNGPADHPALQTDGPHAGKFTLRRVYHPGVPPANEGEGYLRKAAKDSKEEGRRLLVLAITAELRRREL